MLESRVRLGIMSALAVNDSIDFKEFKNLLGVTDGNLASHLRALEEAEYIVSVKSFVGRKPNTRYTVTAKGQKNFREYLETIETLIKNN
jgi:DNA-binding MarR family transcriptional regulator